MGFSFPSPTTSRDDSHRITLPLNSLFLFSISLSLFLINFLLLRENRLKKTKKTRNEKGHFHNTPSLLNSIVGVRTI